MANGNSTQSGTGAEKSSRATGSKPLMFLVDPSGENLPELSQNVNNLERAPAEFIKLWIMGYIQSVFVKNNSENVLRPHKTNFEGCLVEPKKREIKGKLMHPWAGLMRQSKGQVNEYQFFLSTISLEGLDIKNYFSRYSFPDTSKGSSGYIIDEKKMNVWRPYEVGDHEGPIDETWCYKYHIVKIPLESLEKRNTLKTLEYWESIIFFNSESGQVKAFRDNVTKSQASPEEFDHLKPILKEIRGDYLIGYKALSIRINERALFPGEVSYINETGIKTSPSTQLPYLMVDRVEGKKMGSTQPLGKFQYLTHEKSPPAKMLGPFWVESEFINSVDPGKSNEKQTVQVYKMKEAVQGEEKLPFASSKLPSVMDTGFLNLFDKAPLNQLFSSEKPNEERVKQVMKTALKTSSYGESMLNHFYYGYGNNRNECLLDAFNRAAMFWKYGIRYEFDDIMKTKGSKKSLSLETNIKFTFDTKTDAFSESLAPLHIYSQIKSWWNGLSDNDKFNMKNCDFITVRGYSSELGGVDSDINVNLRINRAWKTAQSLWLLLKEEFKKMGMISRVLLQPVAREGRDPGTFKPDDRQNVPIYYWGEASKPTSVVLTPHANLQVKLTQDKKIVEEAISKHVQRFPDDNPDERIAIVSFVQEVPALVEQIVEEEKKSVEQYVKEEMRLLAAEPLCGYRVLYHYKSSGSGIPDRILVYIPKPSWK